jgi:hypothetical protein
MSLRKLAEGKYSVNKATVVAEVFLSLIFYNFFVILSQLESKCSTLDESSEELGDQFVNGEMDMQSFIQVCILF